MPKTFFAAQHFSGRAIRVNGKSFVSFSNTMTSRSMLKVGKATLLFSGQPLGGNWMLFATF